MVALVGAFHEWVKVDCEVDKAQRELSLERDINLQDLFKCFDTRDRGVLNASDWRHMFNQMGLSPSKYDTYLMLRRHCLGIMTFPQFARVFVPLDRSCQME